MSFFDTIVSDFVLNFAAYICTYVCANLAPRCVPSLQRCSPIYAKLKIMQGRILGVLGKDIDSMSLFIT